MVRLLIGVVFLFVVLLIPSVSLAQDVSSPSADSDSAVSDTRGKSVEYVLPYPGVLPDHPFYPLKMLRDRVILFLINDSGKRTEFYLLQADKRLQAGIFLYQKDKEKLSLALDTIEKGENYFFQALSEVENVKKEKKDTGALLGNLELSAQKHEEVLRTFEKTVPPDEKKRVQKLLKRVQEHKRKVDQLILSS